MSAPNGGDAKPKGILKNSSSATTLVDGTHHREQGAGSHTAASTPSIAEYEQQTPNTISSVSSTDSIPPLPSIPYGNRSQHQHRPGVQPSPFSASFDPNVSSYTLTSPIVSSSGSSALTPSIPPRSVNRASAAAVSATTHSRSSSVSSRDVQEQWTQIMASSLQTLATQFTAASQALAASTHITDGSIIEEQDEEGQRPSTSRGPAPAIDSLALSTQTLRSGQEQLMILQRLEAIEKTQAHLMNQMTVLESAHAQAQSTVSSTPATVVEESQQSQNTGVGEIEEVRIDGNKKSLEKGQQDYHGYNQSAVESILPNLISRLEGVESRLESAETKIENLVETIKLDQQRLYARLLNSNVIKNKLPITPLPMANGKAPPNFPATKGEFEHLTKERYEALLKAYNQPIKGDINAKREALREFIGLTAADK